MKFKRLLTVGLMALFCAGTATAASQLNSVQVTPTANAATVNLRTAGSYAHKEYRPDEHLMLVDLTGVSVAPALDRSIVVNSGALKGYKLSSYTSASGSEVTRIELELGDNVAASVNDESDGLKIQFSIGGAPAPASPAPLAAVAAAPVSSPAASAAAAKPKPAEAVNPPRPAPAPSVQIAAGLKNPTPASKDATKVAVTNYAVTNYTAKDAAAKSVAPPQTAPLVGPVAPPVAAASVQPPVQPLVQPKPVQPLVHPKNVAAASLAPSTIRKVSVRPGQGTVDIVIDGPNSARSFLLKDPDRLVLDFSNAVLNPSVKNIAVHTKDVLEVRVGRFQSDPPVIRVVIDLSGPRDFDVVPSDKQVVVRVKTDAARIPSPSPQAAPTPELASTVVPDVAGRMSFGSNDPGVHAALANASLPRQSPAVAAPAPSTSQLRDQRTSAPKAPPAAPAPASPKPAQPAVEAAHPTPPAPEQSTAAVAVSKPAVVAPSQPSNPQTSAPKAPAAALVVTSLKPAQPAVEAARPNPPASEQSTAAVAAAKPAVAGPSQPSNPQTSAPKAPAAALVVTSLKPAQPSVEAAHPTPPASEQSTAAVAAAKPAVVAPSQPSNPQTSAPKAPAAALVVTSLKPAQPSVEAAQAHPTPPASEQSTTVAVSKPPAIGPSQPPDQQSSESKSVAAAAVIAPKAAPPAVETARLNPPSSQQVPATPAIPAPPAAKYTGEPISVNLKDVDLKDFFRLIHEISGLNIVLDPNVRGAVTLVLDDVPWDQALDIVLKNNSLDRELQGNVLRIAATDTLRKEAVDRRAQSEAVALAVDRQTITRFLSYAKATQVVPTIKKFLTARGDVISDDRTNALIISDIPSVLPTLDRLISQLDRKSQEVEIEVRVVSATRSFSRDLGVQLGFNWGNGTSAIGGSNPNASALTPITTPSGVTSTVPLFSNFPAAGPTTGFSFSNITATYGIDAILTAAETHNLAKVLSRPRVVTQSNVRAEVKQGVKIPVYTASTGTSNASVSYIDAVLRLSVLPQITADNTIFLTVDVENTQPNGTAGNGNFILTTQETTTQVLVTDGGTVVIGGVIQTSNSVSTIQTPVLGNIPWLGNLFKERLVKTETDELIFFITPKIIQT